MAEDPHGTKNCPTPIYFKCLIYKKIPQVAPSAEAQNAPQGYKETRSSLFGTVDCFRDSDEVLRSMDPRMGTSYPTYSLPQNRYTLFLVKGLEKSMPEHNIKEYLGILGIAVQSMLQLRFKCRNLDVVEDRLSHRTS